MNECNIKMKIKCHIVRLGITIKGLRLGSSVLDFLNRIVHYLSIVI